MNFESLKVREYETYGESFGGVLNSMFSVKNGSLRAIVTFIFTIALFGWTIDSMLPFVHDSILWLFGLQPAAFKPNEEFLKHFFKLTIPLVLFSATILILYFYRRRNLYPVSYEVISSTPRKCLVYMLSTYSPKNELTMETLVNKIKDKTLTLDEVFAKTNWGHLAFAVAFHAPVLEKCLIITTAEASKLFNQAEMMIRYIVKLQTDRTVECTEQKIGDEKEDSNDIGKAANETKLIYQNLESENYDLKDVVANITGGTAAMSGGMILATLAGDRNIEYVRQGIVLKEELLKSGNIMLAPKTTYKLLK